MLVVSESAKCCDIEKRSFQNDVVHRHEISFIDILMLKECL